MRETQSTQESMTSCRSDKAPLVSIGMLVYNDERYVALAIDDMLAQSIGDFELIISDDASVDRGPDICQEYADSDSRIRFFRQQPRLGMQKNYEFVLRQARGKYFMWAASDDRWDRNYIATLLKPLEQDSSLISVFCPFQFIDEDGNPCSGRLGGVRMEHYSSNSALLRLAYFCRFYSDAFFYGLHRTQLIRDVKVPVWWGINASTPANNNYPVLSYFLARGGYFSVGEVPLFFKRVHPNSKPRHSNEFAKRPIVAHLAFLLRKVNVLYESLTAVYKGSRSLTLTMASSPLFLVRCIYDCIFLTAYLGFRKLRSLLRDIEP